MAAELPAAARSELADWARRTAGGLDSVDGVGGVRPVAAGALHVTLCFLGTQPTELLEEIAAVVAGAAMPVGPVALGGPVWLPRRRPRALAIELRDETGSLTELAGEVAGSLESAIGWAPESRRFRPHVTVGRMRAGAVSPGLLPPTPALVFEPCAMTLYRSRLESTGAHYQALARVELFWPGSGLG